MIGFASSKRRREVILDDLKEGRRVSMVGEVRRA